MTEYQKQFLIARGWQATIPNVYRKQLGPHDCYWIRAPKRKKDNWVVEWEDSLSDCNDGEREFDSWKNLKEWLVSICY